MVLWEKGVVFKIDEMPYENPELGLIPSLRFHFHIGRKPLRKGKGFISFKERESVLSLLAQAKKPFGRESSVAFVDAVVNMRSQSVFVQPLNLNVVLNPFLENSVFPLFLQAVSQHLVEKFPGFKVKHAASELHKKHLERMDIVPNHEYKIEEWHQKVKSYLNRK